MSSITFLGTGTSQGVPMIGCRCEVCRSCDVRDHRLRSSVIIEHNGVNIIVDTSMDFRYQMLRSDTTSIDCILFTHEHKDHTGGLDDVRGFNYLLKRSVDIYAEKRVIDVLHKDFDYAFKEFKYPGVPEITAHTIDTSPFVVKGVEVIPIRGMHYKLPVLGYRIGDICYITDMNKIDISELRKAQGAKVFVINALRHKDHLSHFTLTEALEVISIVKPQNAYLTHISHQLGLHEDISKTLPEGVSLAYDGLKITI